MSIPVDLAQLGMAVTERGGSAYLLTVSDQGTPHAVHVSARLEGEQLVADVGKRSAANAAARPAVSVLFPARGDGDYSLIVDGAASVAQNGEERRIRVTPAKAVLHRPAVAPDPASTCAADCVPLVASPPERS